MKKFSGLILFGFLLTIVFSLVSGFLHQLIAVWSLLIMVPLAVVLLGLGIKKHLHWTYISALLPALLGAILFSGQGYGPIITLMTLRTPVISVADAPRYKNASTFEFTDGRILTKYRTYGSQTIHMRSYTGETMRTYRGLWSIAPLVHEDWSKDQPVPAWVACSNTVGENQTLSVASCEEGWELPYRKGILVDPINRHDLRESARKITKTHNLIYTNKAPILYWTPDIKQSLHQSANTGLLALMLTFLLWITVMVFYVMTALGGIYITGKPLIEKTQDLSFVKIILMGTLLLIIPSIIFIYAFRAFEPHPAFFALVYLLCIIGVPLTALYLWGFAIRDRWSWLLSFIIIFGVWGLEGGAVERFFINKHAEVHSLSEANTKAGMLTLSFSDAILREDLLIRSERLRRWVMTGGKLREERNIDLVAPVVSKNWRKDRPVYVWAYCRDYYLGEPLKGQKPMTVNLDICTKPWKDRSVKTAAVSPKQDIIRMLAKALAPKKGLQSAEMPLIVRWTPNPEDRLNGDLNMGIGFIAFGWIAWLISITYNFITSEPPD